jgi:hypothetical protein
MPKAREIDGTVAQDGTMRALDSSEPVVTRTMIAGGISQLRRQDWDLATATDALTRIYRVMWQLRGA